MSNLPLNKTNKTLFTSKSYKSLNKSMLLIYALFMMVYMLRGKLYALNNQYITLFAWTAPNLMPSFLFTLIGIFYIVPKIFKGAKEINNPKFIWIVNVLNITIFALIEYLHVIFNLGVWDNKDMVASLIGIIIATIVYFKIRKSFA